MARVIKTLLLAIAGIVLLVVLAAGAVLLFFDPNDFREEIAAEVKKATGRELTIEGELSLDLFPWLAVEIGRTSLGNAAGFGDAPFARFENASLSVRLLPLVFRRDIAVGTASIDSLQLNLAVDESGVTNWDDLAATAAEAPDTAEVPAEEAAGPAGLDITSIRIENAAISYRDAAAGSSYRLEEASITTGRIALGEAFELASEFDFSVEPGELAGHVSVSATTLLSEDLSRIELDQLTLDSRLYGVTSEPARVNFTAPQVAVDLEESRLAPGTMRLAALGVSIDATVEPFTWTGDIAIPARLAVERFSLTEVLEALDIEAPQTADPNALQRVAFSADARITPAAATLTGMTLELDETTMTGRLTLPFTADAPLEFDLAADSINLDGYMAPPSEEPAAEDTAATDDFEIPVDTIRNLEAQGRLRVREATFAGMAFSNVELGLRSGSGKLRLNPLSAELFDGTYQGNIRIDASRETPVLSVDEKIEKVSLAPLAQAMFDQENLSGTINGSFALNAQGRTLAAMRRALDGNMSFELADGAWEGTDLWYQLRRARAIYRREEQPEPSNPPRTKFSSVTASGTVTDGVFANEDLHALLPFLELTGAGTVDLVAGEVDYALRARVLERPEFSGGASEAEIEEFTEALIPVRIRGPLTDPSVRPDIEAMFRDEVEDALKEKGDELKQRLFDRLRGEREEPAVEGEEPDEQEQPPEEELENRLKDLFNR